MSFASKFEPGSESWCRDLSQFISNAIEADSFAEYANAEPRWHLGASVIGHECSRSLWYAFRWVLHIRPPGRVQRLFQRGHEEEAKFVHRLRRIGIAVTDKDADGKQARIENENNRHFGGSLDGQAVFDWIVAEFGQMLAEFKTHNKSSFDKLEKNGVRKAKPQHFRQMSIYGRRKGYKLGLYVAVCKDDDRLWPEVVPLDWRDAERMEAKALRIVTSQTPPTRCSENSAYQACKSCDFAGICHLNMPIEKNCRSCAFAYPTPDGEFVCNARGNATIPREFVPIGCEWWKSIV